MTGALVRIKRDGIYQAIEIEHLTNDERKEFFLVIHKADTDTMLKWINLLCGVIVKTEEFFDEI